MSKLNNMNRIVVDDFPEDDRQTIALLANILNPFMQQIIASYENNLNSDNLNWQVETFKVLVNATGEPINAGATVIKKQVKLTLNRRVKGIWVINAKNQDDSTNYPTAAPFIDFTQASNLLQLNRIIGLQNAEEYELTTIIIYER